MSIYIIKKIDVSLTSDFYIQEVLKDVIENENMLKIRAIISLSQLQTHFFINILKVSEVDCWIMYIFK